MGWYKPVSHCHICVALLAFIKQKSIAEASETTPTIYLCDDCVPMYLGITHFAGKKYRQRIVESETAIVQCDLCLVENMTYMDLPDLVKEKKLFCMSCKCKWYGRKGERNVKYYMYLDFELD